MSLQDKLDAHKAKSGSNRTPEVRAALQRGTNEVRASGIMDRVLKIDARAPAFALSNQDGATISTAELLKRGPLVLTFYRGHW